MNRGELWTVAGGVYASRPRPGVIIQDDRFHNTDSVTILPITTTATDAPLARLPLRADDRSGLDQDSRIMIDKITTVRRSQLGTRLGSLSAQQLVDVERALLVFLGLAA